MLKKNFFIAKIIHHGNLPPYKESTMATIKATYLGDLKVECEHVDSGAKIITDAPKDNNGGGTLFSPTDLCAASLGACAMTIMGLMANRHNFDVTGTTLEIDKEMSADPRRIGKIKIIFHMPDRDYSEKEKAMIERAANSCPVHKSFAPEVEQVFDFRWAR